MSSAICAVAIPPATIPTVIIQTITIPTIIIPTIRAESDECNSGDYAGDSFERDDADQEVSSPVPQHVKRLGPSELASHAFPPRHNLGEIPPDGTLRPAPEERLDRNQDLWMYRDRSVALLRRYLRYSLETGRLPSVLGSEFFRTRVTSYGVKTFEDRVIFVHDVETCLNRIDAFSQQVIARVVLQEHGHEQAARMLGCTRMTLHRKLLEALDTISEVLLEAGLLDAIPSSRKNSCQGGENDDFPLSDCEDGK